MKIGLCGNSALADLALALDASIAGAEIVVGATGRFAVELSEHPGAFASLDVCVVAINWRELAPAVYRWGFGDDFESAASSFDAASEALEISLKDFRAASVAQVLVFSPMSAKNGSEGIVDRLISPSRRELLCRCQARFDTMCRAVTDVFPVDIDGLLMQMGASNAFDPEAGYVRGNPFTPPMTQAIAAHISEAVVQFVKYPIKCLVLDCDETLWGGVVGESGTDGILLADCGAGKAFYDFQIEIERLYKQGVILAICSKNNTCDVLDAFERHPHMILRPKMISCFRINWDDKPKNMLGIAEELNIGLDAIMFADDNPSERAMMKAALPEVEILELPDNPACYADTLAQCSRFWPLQITRDDAAKGAFFVAEHERKQSRELAANVENYLAKSDISVTIGTADSETMPRVSQLFNKTNQFNLTTKRYSQAQLETIVSGAGNRLFAMAMRDRFGEYGIIAAALVLDNTIDSFVLSCRAFGKRAENAFLAWVLSHLKHAGHSEAFGVFVPSERNSMAKSFYKEAGFILDRMDGQIEVWRYDLSAVLSQAPSWIRIT
jgi:FkbH-like protein